MTFNDKAVKVEDMQTPTIKNDFVITVATVNGSGSQSANTILLKTLFRMGVPVSGKNVFPSNIAGLPTWFWIRASAQGYSARRARPNIVVALNPQTIADDFNSVLPGGYFLYHSDIKLAETLARKDVTKIALPIKSLVDASTDQVKIKKLLANIVYVGILAELLNLNSEDLISSLQDQFAGKASVLESNLKAMQAGQGYAKEQLAAIGFTFKAEKILNGNQGKIILDGNTASGLGLIYGGATFAAWYPITPSSSLVESFIKYLPQVRSTLPTPAYAVVQAEDELSAVCMAIGAGWQGARAFTATSGPGISLMQEAVGFAYYTEIPVVIWDVQRVGPSTGMPTRTAQGDLLSAVFASHGDTKHPVLLPGSGEECFTFGQKALDLSEALQSPVFVLTDLDLGMNLWTSPEFKFPQEPLQRGKVVTAEQIEAMPVFERYGNPDQDGVAYRALPGTRHPKAPYLTRGSGHNKTGAYTEKADEYQFIVDRLAQKWELAKSLLPAALSFGYSSPIGILFYGSAEPAVLEARDQWAAQSLSIQGLRVRGIPFGLEVEDFLRSCQRIYVLDLNRDGQMWTLLKLEYPAFAHKLITIRHYDGTPITAEAVYEPILIQERELQKKMNEVSHVRG